MEGDYSLAVRLTFVRDGSGGRDADGAQSATNRRLKNRSRSARLKSAQLFGRRINR
jgi:hypothetical protein